MSRSAGSRPITIFATVAVVGLLAPCLVCGCGGRSGGFGNTTVQQTPIITTNAAVTAKTLYSADSANSTVDAYTANQSGAVTPTATIPIANLPVAIAGDAEGNLYVGVDTPTGGQVIVLASGATTPSRTITLPNPGSPDSNQVASMTTDSLGNLYVAGSTVGGTSGVTSVHVDSAGNIFVAEVANGHQAYLVYSATADGNLAPSSTLSPARGSTLDAQFYLK